MIKMKNVRMIMIGVVLLALFFLRRNKSSREPFQVATDLDSGADIKSLKDIKTPTIINFDTEWCGWSKKFKPEWEKFIKLNQKNKLRVINIKCDTDGNKKKCMEFGIEGFPTVIYFDGKEKGEMYQGDRTFDGLMKFVKTKN